MNQPFDVHGRRPEPGQPIRRGDTVTEVALPTVYGPPSSAPYMEQQQPERKPEWILPPGAAKRAAEEAAREASPMPTEVDALVAETKALPEWPENSPPLEPIYRLDFRARATAMRVFGELKRMDVPDIKAGQSYDPDTLAKLYDALAVIDDFLATVATDADAYKRWVKEHDMAEFLLLWQAYASRMQPGEASSSSS
jgi:hypothetical protein